MRRAIELARVGWGRVAPNPLVGAVVVRDGQIVGEGAHARFGGPHAELAALEAGGERTEGATLYVTLEPCAHEGKTPPCCDAILAAGIRRVVVAVPDPNPAASGGVDRLRAGGIDVELGVEQTAAERLNAAFLCWHRRGASFTALKLALSRDDKIAKAPGTRSRITGPVAQAETHRLRAGFDAILIGRVTAMVDDPLLTVRGDIEPRDAPVRVVLDSALELSAASRLATTVDVAPLWVFCAPDADAARRRTLETAGVRVIECDADPSGGLDLRRVLEILAAGDRRSVLVEGGARMAGSLLAANLVQRFYLFRAPHRIGPGGLDGFASHRFDVEDWTVIDEMELGPDRLTVLEPESSAATVAVTMSAGG